MTQKIEVAVADILRSGVWALRGLGMKYGVAERASPLLAWTEGVEGGALKSLRENGAVIENATSLPIQRNELSPGHWVLNVPGKSLLEVGPVAVDLLTYGARTVGRGQVDISGIVDPIFVSAICRLATRRSLWITAASSGSDLQMGGVPVPSIHAYPRPDGTAYFTGDKEGASGTCVGESGKAPIVLSFTASLYSEGVNEKSDSPVDLDRRYHDAEVNNIVTAGEDIANLYELERRAWAPTSERSRGQALV